ncbi:MAG: hypothetical protein RJA70_3677 [Pseudomonadota bacterium]|jgi:hypothetical protein
MKKASLLLCLSLFAFGCSTDDSDKPADKGSGNGNETEISPAATPETPHPLDKGAGDGNETEIGETTANGVKCAAGYTCSADPGSGVVWVIKNDGNVNGPNCQNVCEGALSQNCEYRACDEGRPVEYPDMAAFAEIAEGLGFTCREGGCWDSESPAEGLYLVSIATDEKDGSKSCYFPKETQLSCSVHPGNANCFGERYSAVCPCVPKALDQACQYECPPHNTTRAVWKTSGTSCLERINYWRKKACEDGWVECPPAGLPPMSECTACHECTNSEAQTDSKAGAHASFTRCGELVQGEGGGATCADVIDGFVSERAADAAGVVRCTGHCGPIVAPGCQTFSWGKAKDSDFHTLNWGNCNVQACEGYCTDNPDACFTHATSPSLQCDDPEVGKEPGPQRLTCR